MIFIYVIILFTMAFIVGKAFILRFDLNRSRLISNNPCAEMSIGTAVIVSLSETMAIILPGRIVCLAIVAITVFSMWWLRLKKYRWNNVSGTETIMLSLTILVPIFVIGFPQICNNALYTVIGENSDFAYYFGSIEWLKKHSIIETVGYSHQYPFYSLAEYMINTTRIGMDVFGSVIGCLFLLDAHQVFPILSVYSACLLSIAVFSLVTSLTNNKPCSVIFGVYIGVCGNTISLIASQYVPQVMGMAYLILSIGLIAIVLFDGLKENVILCGLVLSAVMAVYCEYTIYIFAIGSIMLIWGIIQKRVQFKLVASVLALMVLFNIFGFYRAICFNLNILNQVIGGGTGTIDPYNGNMLGISRILACFAGFSMKNYYSLSGTMYKCAATLVFIVFSWYVIQIYLNKDMILSLMVTSIIIVVVVLELFFRHSNAGYEEYKHMSTASALLMAICALGIGRELTKEKTVKISKKAAIFLVGLVAYVSISDPMQACLEPVCTVDADTMRLQEAAELVPDNTTIAIDNSLSWANCMAVVYAIKDQAVDLPSEPVSYFQMFQKFEDKPTKYTICQRNSEIALYEERSRIIWCNEKYALIENMEIDAPSQMRITGPGWGHSEGTTIYTESDCITNTTGEEGFVLYGPYIQIPDGRYDITLEYSVIRCNGSAGYFDIYNQGEIVAIDELKNDGSNTLTLSGIEFKNMKATEFRVYVNKDSVVKVEGVSCKKVSEIDAKENTNYT